jgi:dTDP-4-amino-4,6-dideoxygalactose transaminase
MISVTKTYLPSIDAYYEQIEKIWQSGFLTNNGSVVKQLGNDLRNYLSVDNLELVANGTLALQLAIKALDLKGEIITTPYSYVATTTAILWEGCEPVFVDIDANTFCINPDLIESAITERTCAILATHVYGYPCDVINIELIAKKHNLKVIYDAAHCFGVKLNGESLLMHGDASILSFHATKLFHTAEGGAVVCNDKEVLNRVSLMKKFGHIGEDEYLDIGINAKMSELHAAMGLCVLPKVDELIELRKLRSERYNQLFGGLELQILSIPDNLQYNYAYYPVVFPDHSCMLKAREALIEKDIIPRRYFFPSLNTLPYLRDKSKITCSVSEDVSQRVLALPLSHELALPDVEQIAEIVKGVL